MIILDTNVVSEPLRSMPNAAVVDWLNRQARDTLHFTTISLAELLFGVAGLPAGRRREALGRGMERLVEKLFGSRILAFDAEAAKVYPPLITQARAKGRSIRPSDGFIAAIAASRGFGIATRDTGPFVAAGLSVIDPWTET